MASLPSDFDEQPIKFSEDALVLSKGFQAEPSLQREPRFNSEGLLFAMILFVILTESKLVFWNALLFCATQLGFNLLVDRTGNLLMKKKNISRKDIGVNARASWQGVVGLHKVAGSRVDCCFFVVSLLWLLLWLSPRPS